jgi:hypothetical protein
MIDAGLTMWDYRLEWRKRLDSGNANDWTLKPG